jgi:hypothetical protein
MQPADLFRREGVRPSLRVDSRPEQRLIDVDISQTTDETLVEEHGLDLARAAPQALFKPRRREFALERLTAKPLFEKTKIVAVRVNDATELPLIGEPKIEAVGELDCQAFKAKWRLLVWDHAQPAGHPQVDDDSSVIVEVDNEVLGTPADTTNDTSFDPNQDVFDSSIGENARKITDPERADPLTDDLVDQGAPDGFDLGQFWHTRTMVVRRERRG